jgi:hypothetical protein
MKEDPMANTAHWLTMLAGIAILIVGIAIA